ncbi:Leucine-responsive regulatory protein [Cedecea davisae]|uniref:Transcriptional regulator, AsnC family n=2 Tax=Cedecea davisae TaxID=158484 RepID=S3JA44_9ENTR|nr:Lrp/AsnC family transcriptional regulator [Cedecea davisae]EPF17007.1 transcriptional regulator, AsnC family [Cedecea davisae DSM 4568]MBU4681049.1 Lrp/AsnC family transcriptional regulator [Cedecea davisae]MBU4685826.1 Lrp/AsnC family transcriptional regulator [Cedecea davisae]STA45177.1 Leucine-responsive regulatory protein [Cedecea davisae]
MKKETDSIKQNGVAERNIDAADRRILSALVEDATISYADLGEKVALSAPAVHERVKRLRRSGVIQQTSAIIDPKAINKNLLAFVHIDTKGWGKTPDLLRISAYPEVEEIHSVAGDTSMLLKVRTEDSHALEALLAHLYEINGVLATRTYIVLSTYLERPVQPGITSDWPGQE